MATQEDEERSESRFCTKTWLLYAKINCLNKFVVSDELPAVQVASESTVARVQRVLQMTDSAYLDLKQSNM